MFPLVNVLEFIYLSSVEGKKSRVKESQKNTNSILRSGNRFG